MRDVAFGADGAVGMDAVTARYESELANEYGNLASRTIAMIRRYRDGVVPAVDDRPGARRGLRRPRRRGRGRCSTAPRSPRRSSSSGSGCGAATATSRSGRRGSSPRTRRRPPSSTATLASLAEGLRVISVLLIAVHAGEHRKLLDALGARRCDCEAPRSAPSAAARTRERARAAVPEAGVAVIDSHTHLASLRAAGRRAGRRRRRGRRDRIVTVGTTARRCRAALAAAEDFPQVYAAIGRHPNEATGFDDADLAELEALAAHEQCVAIGETGLDYYRDYAPRADQERAFEAQIELARGDRQAARDPHARRRRRHARDARRARRRASA